MDRDFAAGGRAAQRQGDGPLDIPKPGFKLDTLADRDGYL
jgi:hypothetical protein